MPCPEAQLPMRPGLLSGSRCLAHPLAGVPQPVAIIAIGEDANNLAITRRQQEPSWPSRISRVYDGARAASTRVMCTYNIIIQVDQNQWRRVLVVADRL